MSIDTVDGSSQMGSGSLPTQNIPTRLVTVSAPGVGPDELAARLRRHAPPIFARIRNDQLLFDPRTLLPGDEEVLVEAVVEVLAEGG